jgi:hypothetical protein
VPLQSSTTSISPLCFRVALGGRQISRKAAKLRFGFAHVFLTVRVNRQAATLALGLNLVAGKRGNVRKKVNDLETTLVSKRAAPGDLPLTNM